MSTEDKKNVVSERQKPSVEAFVNDSLNRGILVDVGDDQLIIGTRPRECLSVAICASENVADSELEQALQDVLDEYRHIRAVSGHGFYEMWEVGGSTPAPVNTLDLESIIDLAIEVCDDQQVAFYLRHAAQYLDCIDRGDGIETDGGVETIYETTESCPECGQTQTIRSNQRVDSVNWRCEYCLSGGRWEISGGWEVSGSTSKLLRAGRGQL